MTTRSIAGIKPSSLGDYDYDLSSGRSAIPAGQELHGIKGEPVYVEGNGMKDGKGRFFLAPTSPGHDAALRLPNFNDDLTGQGPDIGAHEAGTPPMEFGLDAHRPQKPLSSEIAANATGALKVGSRQGISLVTDPSATFRT